MKGFGFGLGFGSFGFGVVVREVFSLNNVHVFRSILSSYYLAFLRKVEVVTSCLCVSLYVELKDWEGWTLFCSRIFVPSEWSMNLSLQLKTTLRKTSCLSVQFASIF